jgi:hypothetical protein
MMNLPNVAFVLALLQVASAIKYGTQKSESRRASRVSFANDTLHDDDSVAFFNHRHVNYTKNDDNRELVGYKIYQPIRIAFDTVPIDARRATASADIQSEIDEITSQILPATAQKWSSHLRV